MAVVTRSKCRVQRKVASTKRRNNTNHPVWDTPTRTRVRTLKSERKISVPTRTQRLIITSTSDRTNPATKSRGRPHTIDEDAIQTMERSLKGYFKNRTLNWAELGELHGSKPSERTIKRRMNAIGYKKCKACQKKWLSEANMTIRWDTSDEWRTLAPWQWKQWHFSDETHFHMNSRRTEWVIRTKQERHCPDCIQKKRKQGASQWHVWSMISWGYKGPLVSFDMMECAPEDETKGTKNNPLGKDRKKGGGNMT